MVALRHSLFTVVLHHSLFTVALRHSLFTVALRHSLFTVALRHSLFTVALRHSLFTVALRHSLFTVALRHSLFTVALRHSLFTVALRHSLFTVALRHSLSPPYSLLPRPRHPHSSPSPSTQLHKWSLVAALVTDELHKRSLVAALVTDEVLHKRSLVAALVTDEVVTACTNAPRGNEQYAAVFAAFIAATASTVGIDFAANFAATLAIRFEAAYEADEALGLRNLTMLFNRPPTQLILPLPITPHQALYEADEALGPPLLFVPAFFPFPANASFFLELFVVRFSLRSSRLYRSVLPCSSLQGACGLALRADDPVAMKEFILAVQSKAADIRRQAQEAQSEGAAGAKAAPVLSKRSKAADIRRQAQEAQSEGAAGAKAAPVLSKRVEFVLETITDIKNNLAPHAVGCAAPICQPLHVRAIPPLTTTTSHLPSQVEFMLETITDIKNNRAPRNAGRRGGGGGGETMPVAEGASGGGNLSCQPFLLLTAPNITGGVHARNNHGHQEQPGAPCHPLHCLLLSLQLTPSLPSPLIHPPSQVEFMLRTITDIKNNRAPRNSLPLYIIVEFMLETITDIKNNRAPRNAGRRGGSGTMGGTGGAGGTVMGGGGAAVGGGGGAAGKGKGKGKGAVSVFTKGGGGAEASDGSTAVSRLQKWLLKFDMGGERVSKERWGSIARRESRGEGKASDRSTAISCLQKWLLKLRSLTWQRLIDPHKHGQWWHTSSSSQPLGSLPATSAALGGSSVSASLAVQLAGNALLDAADVAEAERLMQLAAAQRMNTDARRAVFCVIMSAEDYIDAFEKLLRLGLPGKQVCSLACDAPPDREILRVLDREILRVLVECCMQERHFNKYYSLLAGRLCGHARSHKFSLQYCLWDHYQQLPDMDPRRSLHLAQFAAQIVGNHALSLALLK
ncbi:unnamed protein product, partial [Closterium sp. NIES-65]